LGNGEIIGCGGWNLADTEWQVSFLTGYAGTDFIENLYKIKQSYFSMHRLLFYKYLGF